MANGKNISAPIPWANSKINVYMYVFIVYIKCVQWKENMY